MVLREELLYVNMGYKFPFYVYIVDQVWTEDTKIVYEKNTIMDRKMKNKITLLYL